MYLRQVRILFATAVTPGSPPTPLAQPHTDHQLHLRISGRFHWMASSYNYTFYYFLSLKCNTCKDNKALGAEVAFNVQVTLVRWGSTLIELPGYPAWEPPPLLPGKPGPFPPKACRQGTKPGNLANLSFSLMKHHITLPHHLSKWQEMCLTFLMWLQSNKLG